MSLTEFFKEADKLDIRLTVPVEEAMPTHSLSNEALFQLPLLAMTILAISKGTSKPLLPEIGQLVGECLERNEAEGNADDEENWPKSGKKKSYPEKRISKAKRR